ncbi:pirin family protein [Rhodococcus sp. D2-41]|uniref:Pirin family protein n=1 Tax=Speluncibacter jeojiensis TaxID=2710754 RepID=A0A9X4MA88_9ACTN|nr:pirin family protein [Rhodococcus sp. D2-41]MDG3009568.1 pirin family protein [Rhodococcus sp. D2-41]MDG3016771.1 pirin family protein [Corynebacteriales bacterium D3-21]
MSNLETTPTLVTCAATDETRPRVLEPRQVPLGGPRGMPVRRTLPQRERSLIGAWCFLDHYGPDDVSRSGGMNVAGHPHTGLQTVSWLFTGEIEHRDTLGTHEFVRPGEVNLMTAGAGIAHSEYSTPLTTVLHGAQLWVALPTEHRFTAPTFEHHVPAVLERDGAQVRVFIGTLLGDTSPVRTFSPLVGAEITLPPGGRLTVEVEPGFEHGVLVDTGEVAVGCAGVDAIAGSSGQLIYLQPGSAELHLEATGDRSARVLLLGGEPLGEQVVMWWNFIGRTHEDIVEYRGQWQQAREGAANRFAGFPSEWDHTLPAPELPNARLRPRG